MLVGRGGGCPRDICVSPGGCLSDICVRPGGGGVFKGYLC